MKVVINRSYGIYGLSEEAIKYLTKTYNLSYHEIEYGCGYFDEDLPRSDPRLIECIEKIGVKEASGLYAKLKIVEVPDDVQWIIDDYDGMEVVEEVHRSWF